MEKEFIELSNIKRDKILSLIKKYPVVNNQTDVDLALKGLDLYHCTNQQNIIKIIQEGEIKTKELSGASKMTNAGTDITQGFQSYVSLSIGNPWYEYGNYCFVYGLDKINDSSLFFFKDPWQLGSKKLQDSYLIKSDFIILIKELLLRDLYLRMGKIVIKKIFSKNLHKLIKTNCKRFEVKNNGNLKLSDSDEFFCWSKTDDILLKLSRILGNKLILLMMGIMVIIKYYLYLR